MSSQINSFDLAPILIQTGYGIPDHISPLGSEYTDLYTAFKYYNTNGLTNWVQYLDSYFSGGTGGGTIFSGGTVTGSTYFLNGLSANTISATTYLNLPTDIRVTGSSLNPATYDFTLIRNDGVTITSNLGLLATDMTVTGGTYNINTGIVTFTNNTGGTFNVSGFSSGMTDTFVTGGTYSAGTAVFNNNKGIKFNVTGFTNINSLNGLTANTQTFQTGTAGINFTINSTGSTHTFNLPDASTTARGVVTVNDQQFSGLKNFTDNIIVNGIRVWRGTNNSATNIGIGLDTLIDNTGNQNTVLGYQSASPVGITNGSFITAVGYQSLKNIPGNNNTAVGHTSGFILTGGSQNTFIGSQAGGIVGQLTNVTNSSAIGYQAITTKNNQIVLGNSAVTETVLNGKIQIDTPTTSAALYDILTRNTTSGLIEKVLSTSIQEKITIGPISLIANASGASLSNGILTLHAANATSGGVITTGTQIFGGAKTFINGLTANTISATTYYNLPRDIRVTGGTYSAGTTTFTNNTGGTYNVSGYTYIPHLGYDNLNSTIWNYGFGGNINNISFGENSLVSNTIGEYNTAFGSGVLTGNTTGNYNTGVGNYALNSNITGEYNTGIGSYSLYSNTSGVQNFGIGSYSLYSNTTGSYNTGIGVSALENNIVGERNISIGGFSLYQNIGSRNIAIGFFAGSATLGDDNILFGSNSNNITDGLVSGSNNTIIGTSVSGIINGSNNTIFGKPTGLSSTTSNNIVIADGSGNIRFIDDNINTILPRLAGSGNRMIIAGPNGELSSTTIFDTFVTGGTYSDGTTVFTNNIGGTFNVTGFSTSNGVTFTGGTVTGPTNFIGGLTANTFSATTIKTPSVTANANGLSANTISATTYYNLPRDIRVTGGTYNSGNLIFINNTGGTFNITGLTTTSGYSANYYGSFSNNGDLPVSGANTPTVWTYDTTEISNGIVIENNSQIKINNTGVYEFGYSPQIEKTQGSDANVTIWVAINGEPVTRSSSTMRLVSNSTLSLPYVAFIFSMNANDYLEFYFSSDSQYVQLTALSGLTSPTRPNSPSLIVDVKQVGNTISNTLVGAYLPLTGGTVSGATRFTAGLTANTISATTYLNLPTDVRVTGGTYNAGGIATFTNNIGGTFNVTGFTSGGTETTNSLGALINSADDATPLDSDYVATALSGVTGILKKISWTNVKAFLKTYFDTLYSPAIYNITITSTANINTETPGLNNSISYNQNGKNVMINNSGTDIIFSVNTGATTNFIASYTKLGAANITFSAGTASLIAFPNIEPVVILDGLAGSTALLTRTNNSYYLLINNIYS